MANKINVKLILELLDAGEYDRADEYYQKAMSLSPDTEFIISTYADFLWCILQP